jgi:hypothetical protein
MLTTLHLIEPTFDYNTINSKSVLLTDPTVSIVGSDYHTSLGDINSNDIIDLSKQFDQIDFVDNQFDLTSDIYKETIVLLNFLSHQKIINNFTPANAINFATELKIKTKSSSKKLWVFGCSHSHGVGLDDINDCYTNRLAQQFGVELMSITNPGSSIDWSLRHLINADIGTDDIVVWQLTTPGRVTLCEDYSGKTSEEVLAYCKNRDAVNFYSDLQIFYKQISLLNYGIEFLRSKKIKFMLTSFDTNKDFKGLFYHCLTEYTKHKEYCYVPNLCQDFGNDQYHYGPKSHRQLANYLLSHHTFLNYNE